MWHALFSTIVFFLSLVYGLLQGTSSSHANSQPVHEILGDEEVVGDIGGEDDNGNDVRPTICFAYLSDEKA